MEDSWHGWIGEYNEKERVRNNILFINLLLYVLFIPGSNTQILGTFIEAGLLYSLMLEMLEGLTLSVCIN